MANESIDGFVSLVNGVHTDLAPELLQTSFYARGINLSCRNGLLRSRPGFTRHAWAPGTGVYQGGGVWCLNGGERLVAVVGGRVTVLSLDTAETRDFGILLDATAQVHTCQVDRFFVIQDGVSRPVVLEDNAGTPAVGVLPDYNNEAPECDPMDPGTWVVPVWTGTVMAYVHGRLHMVPARLPPGVGQVIENMGTGGPYFLSSDISLPNSPEDALFFTETEYLTGGGAHGLPQEMGFITAMAAYRNSATGTGYGPLVVFAKRGVAAFDVSIPRSQWSDQQIGQVLFFGPGTISPWSVLAVNNDLLYRGLDGLRLIGYTASQAAGSEGVLSNLPISTELGAYFRTDAKNSLPFVSTATCNNRLFVTIGGTDRTFSAIGVMDLAPTAAFRSASVPMYPGVWQLPGNRRVCRVFTAEYQGEPSLFAVAEDLTLWRLNEVATSDDGEPIHCRLVTRGMTFQTPLILKKLQYAELGIKNLTADAALTVYFRPVGYPLWGELASRVLLAPDGTLPQGRRKLRLPLEAAAATKVNVPEKMLLHLAQRFQFMLEWTGSFEIDYFRAVAILESDGVPNVCDETAELDLQPSIDTGVEIGEYLA